MRNWYKRGSANGICDVCGEKYKLDQLKKRWDGLWVCPFDFENRHPQDFLRAKKESFKLPITKPRPQDVFVGAGECTILGRTAWSLAAVAGCSIAGYAPAGLEYLLQTIDPEADDCAVSGYAITGLAKAGNPRIFVVDGEGVGLYE